MATVRFDVLPDAAGYWSVTRDRVLVAEFDDRQRAIDYADACADALRKSGLTVRIFAPESGD